MKNIIFDVDDTLYNLMEPFEKAHKELMAARTDADCEELFEASRTYSDEAFCMSRFTRSVFGCANENDTETSTIFTDSSKWHSHRGITRKHLLSFFIKVICLILH